MALTHLLSAGGRVTAKVAVHTAAYDPTAFAAAGTQEESVTVPGVKVGDVVLSVTKPTHTSGFAIASARVSAVDTVAVTSVGTGVANPGSETYTFVIAHLS